MVSAKANIYVPVSMYNNSDAIDKTNLKTNIKFKNVKLYITLLGMVLRTLGR